MILFALKSKSTDNHFFKQGRSEIACFSGVEIADKWLASVFVDAAYEGSLCNSSDSLYRCA